MVHSCLSLSLLFSTRWRCSFVSRPAAIQPDLAVTCSLRNMSRRSPLRDRWARSHLYRSRSPNPIFDRFVWGHDVGMPICCEKRASSLLRHRKKEGITDNRQNANRLGIISPNYPCGRLGWESPKAGYNLADK